MKYVSVFSGIEAATVAWHPLGWKPLAFSEIDPFASSVLSHRYPEVPNHGDITKHHDWSVGLQGSVDVLVGGSPCQAFSVAGLRRGLEDPRGQLTLTYLQLAAVLRPRWIVWENVPGVLSADGGRAFGAFLGALAELGYGFAYRVLDARFFGVPQRRRRVFLVARSSGDWQSCAKVLLEPEGLRRDHPAGGEARKEVADRARGRTPIDGGSGESEPIGSVTSIPEVSPTVTSKWSKQSGGPAGNECGNLIVANVSGSLCADDRKGVSQQMAHQDKLVVHTFGHSSFGGYSQEGLCNLRASGGDLGGGSETLVAFSSNMSEPDVRTDDCSPCLKLGGHNGANPPAVCYGIDEECNPSLDVMGPLLKGPDGGRKACVVAFTCKDHGADAGSISPTLRAMPHHQTHANGGGQVAVAYTIDMQASAGLANIGDGTVSPTLCRPSGNSMHAVAYPIDTQNMTPGHNSGGLGFGCDGDPSFTITKGHSHAVAVDVYNQSIDHEAYPTVTAATGGTNTSGPKLQSGMMVRRLTPTECERLQGFPDGWTMVPHRGKPASDGPRYKALGNSMAVPCMRWIGERIQALEDGRL